MGLKKEILIGAYDVIKKERRHLFYVLYYSALEGILTLSIPLASAFIINSVISHASISVLVLGIVVMGIFVLITILKAMQEYIVEKFQQKVFVSKSIEVAQNIHKLKEKKLNDFKEPIRKLMNYFFDVLTIQKFFPIFVLDVAALIVNVFVSLILLLAFNIALFELGLAALIFYVALLLLLGYNGIKYSIEHSDVKHSTIFFLQQIPFKNESEVEIFKKLDEYLQKYVLVRQKHFKVVIKQKIISFIMQGIIIGGFLILGGFLVINGKLPIGEFVASEIVMVSIISSINRFIKQIDYMYEVAEGLYKVGKLTKAISGHEDEQI